MIFGISTKWVPLSPQKIKKITAIEIKGKRNLFWFSRITNLKKNKKIEIFERDL